MRSPENSSEGFGKLPLPALLTALALGACRGDQNDEIAQIQEDLEQGAREVREAEERSKEESLRLRAEAEAIRRKETVLANLRHDDPVCAEVRATKAILDAIDNPAKPRKGGRSKIVDTESRRGADGTRSDSVLVASGSGTPQDIRNRANAVQRFFDAARAAGGLQPATEICLRRSGSRGR